MRGIKRTTLDIVLGPGHRIHGELIGSTETAKRTIVLLNGALFHRGQWDLLLRSGFLKELPDSCFLLYDYGNIGLSTSPLKDWNLMAVADELRLILGKLGIQRVHLFGLSKGTAVEQLFASRSPERVISLGGYGWINPRHSGLKSIAAGFREKYESFGQPNEAWKSPMNRADFNFFWNAVLRKIALGERFSPKPLRNKIIDYVARRKVFPLIAPTPLYSFYKWFEYTSSTLAQPPETDETYIKAFEQIPVLIQHAINDEILPFKMARDLKDEFPRAQLIQYDRSYSHMSVAVSPVQAHRIVKDYAEFLMQIESTRHLNAAA